ncbi:MAG TPA: enoyl-CoA hydratase/isomerase family protein [Jatrophihabitans sp.]|jgi:enoyl-CoA hydratase/carnithine racemase
MSYETITLEVEDGVAWVTLNRPEVLNAFNAAMIRELHDCWRGLRGNDDARVIVLAGAGDRAFCTGVDRQEQEPGHLPEDTPIGTRGSTPFHFDDPGDYIAPKTAAGLWKPIIAAVNGMACGGAFYLLGECDIILASETATFFDPHTTYGMAAIFEPIMMMQHMPLGEVMRMSLLGAHERMSAKRAHEIGLVQEIVAPEQLHETAATLARDIASQPALAIQGTVRAVWAAREHGYREALEFGKTLIQLGTSTESLEEGQRRFTSGSRTPWRLV